jgi:hypothetical protein
MRRPHGVQLRHPLPFNAVSLGDLTLNPGIPTNDVRTYPADQPPLTTHQNHIKSLHELQSAEVGGNISVQFQSVLQAQLQARQQRTTRVQAPLATKYMLRNSEDAFENACKDPKIRTWLSEKCVDQGRPAAMIVGMYTYSDATYEHDSGSSATFSGGAQDPTGVTNVGVGAEASRAATTQNTYTMPDEQIFAIEYRSLTWKMFRRKTLETARLTDNRWEIFSGDRSKGARGDSDDGTIVEFELGEDRFEELDDDVVPFEGDPE